MKTLIIDNYDSFTYNLYQYVGELKGNPVVYRNDKISIKEIKKNVSPTHIIISPGPGRPENKKDFGICKNVILEIGKRIPMLGVCLGHQGIVYCFGGKIVRAPQIVHGKTSLIKHNSKGLFKGIKNPLKAMRYHSLVAKKDALPKCLKLIAETNDGLIMAVRHREYPIYGIQFHPESFATLDGKHILKNFLTKEHGIRTSVRLRSLKMR